MAGHELIDAYVAALARRLPPDTVDELADGLIETWQHMLDRGRPPTAAAEAAIAEFGPADGVADAFVARAPGRRLARYLLLTGPLFGLCWGTTLGLGRVWTWSVPWFVPAVVLSTLAAVVALLLTAATTRHRYRRTRLGLVGAAVLVGLDATMVGGVSVLAPAFVWPLAVAIPASLARMGLTIGALPRRRTA